MRRWAWVAAACVVAAGCTGNPAEDGSDAGTSGGQGASSSSSGVVSDGGMGSSGASNTASSAAGASSLGNTSGSQGAGSTGGTSAAHASSNPGVSSSHATSGSGGTLPEDPGSFAFTTYNADINVPGGINGRTEKVTAYVPTGASGAPVVVIHPGFCLQVTLYASYAEHLASRGTVAVLLQPPYPALTCPLGAPTHPELAVGLGKALDWVVTEAASGGLAGVADASRMVLAGHSVGGKVSLLLATTDARPKGVFAIDPVDSGTPSVTPELMGQVQVPIIALGETTNSTCTGPLCQACAPAEDNFQQYAQHATVKTDQIEVLGANHMSFVDNPTCAVYCTVCPAGTDDTATTRRLTRRYLTAFTDLVARQDTSAREWLAGAPMAADVAAGLVHQQVFNSF